MMKATFNRLGAAFARLRETDSALADVLTRWEQMPSRTRAAIGVIARLSRPESLGE